MTDRRVVVLGATGMAGHVLTEYLIANENYEVRPAARTNAPFPTKTLDVTNFTELERWLQETSPAIVVNCVGVLVNASEQNTANAILINSYLPHALAALGKKLGFRLIHISTDCVFSGKDGGYSEDADRDGDTTYARTKAIGEVINGRDLTIRTSIVGPELKNNGSGLLHWFLSQRGTVLGFEQVFWSGVTTLELAKAVAVSIEQGISGLVHLAPTRKISKYEVLKLFGEVWKHPISVSCDRSVKCDKSLITTRHDWCYSPPDYRMMFDEMRAWMDDRPSYYAHYGM